MKTLGIALHEYHLANKQLPPAMFGSNANEHRLSGLLTLTPFIQEKSFWDTINSPSEFGGKTYPRLGPVPWTTEYDPWCREFPAFRCPTDPSTGPTLGRTNYAFCVGDQITGLYDGASGKNFRGCFSGNGVGVRYRDILDGLSNTIMMMEIGTAQKRKIAGQFVLAQADQTVSVPSNCMKVIDPDRPGFYSDSSTLSQLGRGGAFADGSGGYALVHTILPPNAPSCALASNEPFVGIFSAGSFHTGGCNILLVDGSVIFITDSIETGDTSAKSPSMDATTSVSPYGLWGALGTRTGEEPIEEQVCE